MENMSDIVDLFRSHHEIGTRAQTSPVSRSIEIQLHVLAIAASWSWVQSFLSNIVKPVTSHFSEFV